MGYVCPPSKNSVNTLAVKAGVPSKGMTLAWVGDGYPYYVVITCPVPFNLLFSDGDGIPDPVNNGTFAAGMYPFELLGTNKKFKITATADATVTYWEGVN